MSEEWTNASSEASAHPAHGDDGLPALAIAAGLVAALAGGGIWAAIAIFGGLEVGWVAWGIGMLAGGAMAVTTPVRSRQLALVAASLALVGLLAGKAMTFAGSAGPISEEILADEAYMSGMAAWELYRAGALPPAVQAGVAETESRGDTLSDALWAAMLTAGQERLTATPEEDRRAIARAAASGMIRQTGLLGGIRLQMSGFDILWAILALATAARIMAGPKAEPVVAEAEAEREREPA